MGLAIFATAEILLYLNGYTSLLLNTAASIAFAALINFGVFGIKNKLKRIVGVTKKLISLIVALPTFLASSLMAAFQMLWELIPASLRALLGFLKMVPALIGAAIETLAILTINLLILPFLAAYLIIYGLILSLSGGQNRIMLKHYDAFGKRMFKPLEKYIRMEAIISIVVIFVIVAVGALILSSLMTATDITNSNAAAANAGYAMNTVGTAISYLPVLAILIGAAFIILIWKMFSLGAQSFSI